MLLYSHVYGSQTDITASTEIVHMLDERHGHGPLPAIGK